MSQPPARPLRDATALILTRGSGSCLRVFLVERSPALKFFGGYWAFPGGTVDDIDRRACDPDDLAARYRAAARELMEETGVFVSALCGRLSRNERDSFRRQWLSLEQGPSKESTKAAALHDRWRNFIDAATDPTFAFRSIVRLTTPEFAPVRYRTLFLHLETPEGEQPEVIPGELAQGRMVEPRVMLEEWRRGKVYIAPPALFLLELLQDGDLAEFAARAAVEGGRLEDGALHPVRFSPGIFVAPLKTPTLPPATTTNCLLVGEREVYVVDPATPDASDQLRLSEKMRECQAAGRRFRGILLTHHHSDHVGAVRSVARRFGLRVFAHEQTLRRLDHDLPIGGELKDGDAVELGDAPDGEPDWKLEVKHTPGHAPGHLCFVETRYRAVIAGDLISTVSSIIIDPPDGHLSTYLQSLRRMLDERITLLYPAHGPAARDGPAILRRCLAHREERQCKLIAALASGPRTIEELLPIVYDDTDPSMFPYAARSLLAGLQKLFEEGRADSREERWRLLGI